MNAKLGSWLLAALTAVASPALAADWYQWRGPEQDGVSREKNLPEKWSSEGENLVWHNEIGGMSSPIVMNGYLYTFTRVGEVPAGNASSPTFDPGPQTQEALVCVDARTGKMVWQHLENMYVTDDPFHRLGWSNCIGDPKSGRVYGLGAQNQLVCLDGKTGKVIWKRQMTEEFGMITTFGGRTPSPAIDEDRLFITGVSFGWGENFRSTHRIFAFNKENGELNWTADSPGIPVDAPYGTPVVGVINGERTVVFNGGNGGIHAYQARTGKHLWSFVASKRGMNCSPIIAGDLVYASWDLDNFKSTKLGGLVCLDGRVIEKGAPKVVWRQDGIEAGFPSPTIWDGILYVATDSAVIYAVDAKTGEILWHKVFGTGGKASLVAAEGKLYYPEANGRMWILKLNGKEKPKVLSHVDVEKKLGREYTIFGSVAICDGRVFLQAANETFCIGEKEPKVESNPIPPAPQEEAVGKDDQAAVLQVRPADVLLRPGRMQTFTLFAFDAKGRPLGEQKSEHWSVGQLTLAPPPPRPKELMRPSPFTVAQSGEAATKPVDAPKPAPSTQPTSQPAVAGPTKIGNLKGEVDAGGTFTAAGGPPQGGAVVATIGQLSGQGRVRVLPPLPWKIDFEKDPVGKPPLTWIGAGMKFAVRENPADHNNKVLVKLTDIPLFARARTYFGAEDMHDYTIEADVSVKETVYADNGTTVRKVPDVGVINSRYILELKGANQTLGIHSWPAALPRNEEEPGLATHKAIHFDWKADTWYHLKLSVTQENDKAVARGKAWPTGTPEPHDWNIQLEDPTPNRNGNPGLWGFSNDHEIYYDNVQVTDNSNGKAL